MTRACDKEVSGKVRGAARRGAFTLIEVTVVSVVIIIIAALTFVAAAPTVKAVRIEGERQMLRSLVVATEAFRQRFGGLPPLVDDGNTTVSFTPPGGAVTFAVRARATINNTADDFLAYRVDGPASRSSVLSPTIFLIGVLSERIDGIDGPGMTACDPTTGLFNRGGAKVEPFFDSSSVKERLVPSAFTVVGEAGTVLQLVDRWGNPVRYYRWLPTRHVPSNTPAPNVYSGWRPTGTALGAVVANDVNRSGEIRSYNVPVLIGNPYEDGAAALRSAGFAFVSAGPDGQLDEALPPTEGVNKDNIVEFGK